MGNYSYSATTPGGEFRNKETNELKSPTRLIWTTSNQMKMKCEMFRSLDSNETIFNNINQHNIKTRGFNFVKTIMALAK